MTQSTHFGIVSSKNFHQKICRLKNSRDRQCTGGIRFKEFDGIVFYHPNNFDIEFNNDSLSANII